MPEPDLVAHIDGGARGNPGPAAYAAIITRPDAKVVKEISHYLGETTNNIAEYAGLLAAVEFAVRHGTRSLRVISDSELLVRQIRGEYKVKSDGLKPLFRQVKDLISRLESFSITHVRREQNREADRLLNRTLDTHCDRIKRLVR
jgi:probable phosphoglycerate mutase